MEEEDNNICCHLLMAKSRVAPLKSITLLRLELQGAVLVVRMKETLIKELNLEFQDTFFWTDSTLSLQCIHNEDKRFKVFVGNGISEIRLYSEPEQWRFVPGKLNPADLGTRGAGMQEAIKTFNGPEFLASNPEEWPKTDLTPLPPDYKEIRTIMSLKDQGTQRRADKLQPIFEIEKTNSSFG